MSEDVKNILEEVGISSPEEATPEQAAKAIELLMADSDRLSRSSKTHIAELNRHVDRLETKAALARTLRRA